MQALDLQIRVHGWALVQVHDDGTDWCYTIGLVERFGHPELCVIDAEVATSAQVIRQLVKGIVARGELPAEHRLMGLQCVEVHRDHLRSFLFARWSEQYGHPMRQGEMRRTSAATAPRSRRVTTSSGYAEAERVAGGVEEDAERRARLVVGRRRTDGQHGLLRSIEVLHHHVEVHLLRHVLAGPLRGAVAVHPLKADALVIGFAAHLTPALVRGGGPPQQQATELGEATRVAAVDDERGEACDGHAKDRTPSSGQVPSDCRS